MNTRVIARVSDSGPFTTDLVGCTGTVSLFFILSEGDFMNQRSTMLLCLIILLVLLSSTVRSQVMDELTFSKPRGFYTENFSLEISCKISDATIRFTKDGSDPFSSPTAKSQRTPVSMLIDPITTQDRDLAPGVIIRACAVKDGILLTKIATHTFLFIDKIEECSPDGLKPGPGWPDPNPGTQFTQQGMDYGMDPDVLHDPRYQNSISDALASIPTISLVTDLKNLFDPDSGIYINTFIHSREWERAASIELLNPDRSPGFQIDAGLRLRGAWGRTGQNFKHAFRLFFRKEYGEGKLHYPLFGDEGVTEFDHVDLRTAQNYSWAYYSNQHTELREVFSRDTQRDMGQPYTRSRYYHLYINGTYWGQYQTQERSEASFGESYLGGSSEDYDVVKVDVTDSLDISNYHIEATDGTLDGFQQIWEMAVDGFRTDESYYRLQGLNPDGSRNSAYPVLVDIDNLIDYMLCTIYVCDPDGPTAGGIPNNFYCMYNRNNNRGFVFFRHDAEHSLMYPDIDASTPTSIGEQFRHFNPRWLHQRLTDFPEYRLRCYDRIYRHLFNDGALTLQANRDRLLGRKAQIDSSIIAESARWGDAHTDRPCTRDDDWMREVNMILDQFFPSREIRMLQQLRSQKLYPDFNPPAFNRTGGIVPKGTILTMDTTEGRVYYTVDGNDTHLPSTLQRASQTILVARNAEKRVFIPTANVDTRWRYDLTFNDTSWPLCTSSPGGIGYDLGSTYDDQISYDIQSQMHAVNSSCMIRIYFDVTQEQLDDFNYMTLRVQHDDGFFVYLNRRNSILSKNFSGAVTWYAAANTTNDGRFIESFDITSHLSKLLPGRNLLAIQAINIAPGDSDFFFSVELVAGNTMKSSGPISPSANAYTGPITIDHTTKIKARVYKDEQWSALNEVTLFVPEGYDNLQPTEIHFHPLDEEGVVEGISDNEFEFIELKNTGTSPLGAGGMKFVQGIQYTFPPGTTISPGEYLVLASNSDAFQTRYGFSPFGEYTGQLDNGGETISLESSLGDTLISVQYDDSYPWPNSPDGSGYSLVRIPDRIFGDPSDPTGWSSSLYVHGNPGFDNDADSVARRNGTPGEFRLHQNYPNPFNLTTTFSFDLPSPSFVTVKIYDTIGREIATIISEELSSGTHRRRWDAEGMATGIYFYQLRSGSVTETKKLVLLK